MFNINFNEPSGPEIHIMQSDLVKQKCVNYINTYLQIFGTPRALDVLEYVLGHIGFRLADLTISDEHELINLITEKIFAEQKNLCYNKYIK